jgi:DNA polymerase-3 subunit chi
MMPRVDFYILALEGTEAREHFCCRLATRAWREGHTVQVRVADEAAAERLDNALWTFDEASFIPHGRESLDGDNPIVISPAPAPGDLMINLTDALPDDWTTCTRIAEIISAEEPIRQTGRTRYRDYQQAGATPQTHRIES